MNLKEPLQFLAMLIPTLLLLALAAFTLAIPEGYPAPDRAAPANVADSLAPERDAVVPTELGPLGTAVVK